MSAYLGSTPISVLKLLFRNEKAITLYQGSTQVWSDWTPLDLFEGGKQGVWYDPSDMTTLFQDVAGTVPVTKDGDPVGLVLDKSQGLESGGMNFKTVKGGFNSSEWVLNPENIDSSGRLVLGPSGRVHYKTTEPMIKNKTYKIVVEIDESINVNYGIRLFYTATSLVGTYVFANYIKEKGILTFYISLPAVEEGYLGIDRVSGHTGEVYINSVSVTEVKGNHASQPLAASRPTYRTDGILHWLEFDGVDDFLRLVSITLSSPSDFWVAIDNLGSSLDAYLYDFRTSTNSYFRNKGLMGSATALRPLTLTSSTDLNGVYALQGLTTTGASSMSIFSAHTAPTTNAMRGKLYGWVMVDTSDNQAEKRESTKQYLTNKIEVTL